MEPHLHGGRTTRLPGFVDGLDGAGQALDRAALFITQHIHVPPTGTAEAVSHGR